MHWWTRFVAGCWFRHGLLMKKRTSDRVFLCCELCGYESLGWDVEPATFAPTWHVQTLKKPRAKKSSVVKIQKVA